MGAGPHTHMNTTIGMIFEVFEFAALHSGFPQHSVGIGSLGMVFPLRRVFYTVFRFFTLFILSLF